MLKLIVVSFLIATSAHAQRGSFNPDRVYEVQSAEYSCIDAKGSKLAATITSFSNYTLSLKIKNSTHTLKQLGSCMALGCPTSYKSADKKVIVRTYREGYQDRNGSTVIIVVNESEFSCK